MLGNHSFLSMQESIVASRQEILPTAIPVGSSPATVILLVSSASDGTKARVALMNPRTRKSRQRLMQRTKLKLKMTERKAKVTERTRIEKHMPEEAKTKKRKRVKKDQKEKALQKKNT